MNKKEIKKTISLLREYLSITGEKMIFPTGATENRKRWSEYLLGRSLLEGKLCPFKFTYDRLPPSLRKLPVGDWDPGITYEEFYRVFRRD